MKTTLMLAATVAVGAIAAPHQATAGPLPAGWTCVGASVCGSLGPDGVVTAPPASGPNYLYITTSGAIGNNQAAVKPPTETEKNGSRLESPAFTLNAGDELTFYFNYVTSDGAQFSDYAWVGLVNLLSEVTSILFTARTTPVGNTVPGFGLPGLNPAVALDPATTPIIAGGPEWSPLGSDSGACFSDGCGYTDWIKMTYTTPEDASGNYRLVFAVTNALDEGYASGLALAGVTIGGVPIDPPGPQPVPEPASLALLSLGLLGLGFARRRA